MNDPVQALFDAGVLKTTLFPPTSRYYSAATGQITTPDGKTLSYVRRRFASPPERFALLQEHAVQEGERLDQIAAKYLSDPEQFWRICDANGAVRPDELIETVGRRLRITLPEGVPGSSDA